MSVWRPTRPNSSDDIADIPSLSQDNFGAIEDILGVEHNTFTTNEATGTHARGDASIVKIGTTAEIAALSSPPTGAMALNTELGVLVQNRSGVLGWDRFGETEWSRVQAYPTSAMKITAGATAVTAVWDTAFYDTFSEMATATGVFTARASGTYAVIVSIGLATSAEQDTSGVLSATDDKIQRQTMYTWGVSGTTDNYLAIDDYPTADDSDMTVANTLGRTDTFIFGTIDQEISTGDDTSVFWRQAAHNNYSIAQGFILAEDSVINAVEFYMETSSTPTNSAWASIQHNTNDVPNGTVIAFSSSADGGDDFETTPTWERFHFTPPVALSGSTKYHLVLHSNSNTPLNNIAYYLVRADQTILASGDGGLSFSDNTGTWTTCAATADLLYKLFEQPYIPAGSTNIKATVNFRGRWAGCICNGVCYTEGTCTCFAQTCTCNSSCFEQAICTCESGYLEGKSCTCDGSCYSFTPCTCNGACYTEGCTVCDGVVDNSGGCTCNIECYLQGSAKPAAIIQTGSTAYSGTATQLTSAFDDYLEVWSNVIERFGYKLVAQNVSSSAVSADISQAYMVLTWAPTRPIVSLGLYKNDTLVEAAYVPIHEASEVANQTVNLFTIIDLIPSDKLHVRISKTLEDDTMIVDPSYTYLDIHRLSGTVL